MAVTQNSLYHYYNQGNNKERVFYTSENYLYFLRLFRKLVSPYCEVIAYCLMPNHFHFLLYATEDSVRQIKLGSLTLPAVNNGFRMLLSSYCNGINKQFGRTGSIFRQRTKAKEIVDSEEDYPLICFNYIHQNPYRSGLVEKMEYWEFSSFREYAGLRHGSLVNKKLAFDLLDLPQKNFYEESYGLIPPEFVKKIF